MLPPIQTVLNATVSHKGQTRQEPFAYPRGDREKNPGGRAGQQSVATANAASGRPNLLDLSGSDAMGMGLTRLAGALAKAMNVPPQAGETHANHALRLANAILGLDPGPRLQAERQLAHILQGLPLRFVALALANPGGQEAARIAAYLEMSRQKGDPIARAVVDSYRQNEAADLGEAGDAAPARAAKPEIDVKGAGARFSVEEQLSQAVRSAALRAGIALPYVAYPIAEQDSAKKAEKAGRPLFFEDGEDDDAGDGDPGGEEQEQAARDGAEDEAGAFEAGDADADPAYSYYQRMSEWP